MTTLLDGHIEVDENHVARISRSAMKVIHLVMEARANGLTASQLHENYPYLTLAQVHAALTYYYDHQLECDAQIEASLRLADEMRDKAGTSPVAARLRSEGKLK